VQVIHRHGARTPFFLWPGMPEMNSEEGIAAWGKCRRPPQMERAPSGRTRGSALTSDLPTSDEVDATIDEYVPCGHGALTKRGEEELETLGRFLRFQYSGSLLRGLKEPTEGEVYVHSTKTSRTILSARSCLRGLYPEMPEARRNQLVQVPYSDDPEAETLIANYPACDRLRQLFHEARERVVKEPLFRDTLKLVQSESPAVLELCAKYDVGKGDPHVILGDTIRSLRGHDQPMDGPGLPAKGLSMETIDALDHCGHRLLDAVHGIWDKELLKLSAGQMLHQLNERITAAVEDRSPLRLALLSAHDVSLGVCLLALDVPCDGWPAFASSAHMELHKCKDGSWLVRVRFFNGLPSEDGQPTREEVITLAEWRSRVEPLLIRSSEEYLQQCRIAPGVPTPGDCNY